MEFSPGKLGSNHRFIVHAYGQRDATGLLAALDTAGVRAGRQNDTESQRQQPAFDHVQHGLRQTNAKLWAVPALGHGFPRRGDFRRRAAERLNEHRTIRPSRLKAAFFGSQCDLRMEVQETFRDVHARTADFIIDDPDALFQQKNSPQVARPAERWR